MDRITRLRVANVRAFDSADIALSAQMTVLIGENGSGKSTILECLEIMRKAAEPSFLARLCAEHQGMAGLLRSGEAALALGVSIEDADHQGEGLDYDFTLRRAGPDVVVEREVLRRSSDGFVILTDTGDGASVRDPAGYVAPKTNAEHRGLALTAFGDAAPDPRIGRMIRALSGIEVHRRPGTIAMWAALSEHRSPPLRRALRGRNLADAWSVLKNADAAHWQHTVDLVRLGLGEQVSTVNTVADAGGGYVALKSSDLACAIPAVNLSDGQLAWLAFVALARLGGARSLLAIDDPELHLHPALLGRVVSMLANLPGGEPVVLSTHANRVLKMLDNPVDAVRVCALDGSRATVSQLDVALLAKWLEEFRDVGALRAAGYLSRVLERPSGDTLAHQHLPNPTSR